MNGEDGCQMRNTRQWGPGVTCGKPVSYVVSWLTGPPNRVCSGCAATLRDYKAPMQRLESVR